MIFDVIKLEKYNVRQYTSYTYTVILLCFFNPKNQGNVDEFLDFPTPITFFSITFYKR